MLTTSTHRGTRRQFNRLRSLVRLLSLQDGNKACISCNWIGLKELSITNMSGDTRIILVALQNLKIGSHNITGSVFITLNTNTKDVFFGVPGKRIFNPDGQKSNTICQHLICHRCGVFLY